MVLAGFDSYIWCCTADCLQFSVHESLESSEAHILGLGFRLIALLSAEEGCHLCDLTEDFCVLMW